MAESLVEPVPALSWKNLCADSTIATRKLLDNVSGAVYPDQFVAILGPSGSGKTTLLNTLACRLDKNIRISGCQRMFDHAYASAQLKALSGYVMQDDILNGNLTVEETLLYTAQLRMKAEISIEMKERRVEEVIRDVGLLKCRNVVVGSPLKKGISGGERKRLCVAMELLASPRILFLDEPTSGLDSVTAFSLCRLLRQLSRDTECAILTTIHQPQAKIFELFDSLFILKDGSVVFNGNAQNALHVWASSGLPLPAYTNPADHLLETITPAVVSEQEAKDNEVNLKKHLPSFHITVSEDAHKPLVVYRNTVPWYDQFSILFRRSFKEQLRRRGLFYTQLIQTVCMAVLIGGVFLQIGDTQTSISRRQAVLFFCVINQGVFGAMSVINSFPSERILTLRERAAGTYFASAYFLAKIVSETPLQLVPPVVFSCIVYFMVGLQATAAKFFMFVFFMILCSVASVSLALAVSALSRVTNVAVVVLPVCLEISRLFGGYFLAPANLPVYFSWLDALSYVKYTYCGISLNELSDLSLSCTADQLRNGVCPVTSGMQQLQTLGIDYISMGGCIGALLGFITVSRLVAFVAIRFLKR
eukprot:GILJ01010646.1.p1 GENE.GILJ01010646.1~~GILJ01010646.1.p1  ORF type:complete len:601 (+),score=87.48 GILJ01010646.1:39-1805(+)